MADTLVDLAESKKYDEVLRVYRDHPDDEVARAADFLREADVYRGAIELYEYLLERGDDEDAHFGVGQCYGKIYDYDTAITHLRPAFAGGRTDGANYYAYILERKHLMDEALQWYERAIGAGYGDDLWTLSHHAYFLEKYGRADAADAAYRDVLTRNPAYTWAVKRYAIFLLRQERVDDSLRLMRDTRERFPTSPFVLMNELEYRIIAGEQYEAVRASLPYDDLSEEFQVLVDLFDYFERFLRHGRSDIGRLREYERRAAGLTDSVHRDVDDLTELLQAAGGDVEEWQRLVALLLK